jgi:hypothetical protein
MSLKQQQRKPVLKGDRQRRILWPCIPIYGQ